MGNIGRVRPVADRVLVLAGSDTAGTQDSTVTDNITKRGRRALSARGVPPTSPVRCLFLWVVAKISFALEVRSCEEVVLRTIALWSSPRCVVRVGRRYLQRSGVLLWDVIAQSRVAASVVLPRALLFPRPRRRRVPQLRQPSQSQARPTFDCHQTAAAIETSRATSPVPPSLSPRASAVGSGTCPACRRGYILIACCTARRARGP